MKTNAGVGVVATISTSTFNEIVTLRMRHGLSDFISTEKWFIIERTQHTSNRNKNI
jgi:hypothetical protein